MKVTIDLAPNGMFNLELPSAFLENRSHSIQVPATVAGISILRKILTDRQREIKRIGNDSSPTQWQVEQWLTLERKLLAATKTAEAKTATDEKIAKAKGLDISSLNIGDLNL